MDFRWVVLWTLALVLWTHQALLRDGGILGAPQTDVLRAVWGLQHQVRALPDLPFWTDHVGFPGGVKVVVLPFVSSLVGAPLTVLLGPVAGYDVWVLGLLWGSGLATAWFVRGLTRSSACGLLAGSVILVQPMMFAAITDGTAEFVAWWAVPMTLGALQRGIGDRRWARAAAVFAVIVAMDSPYHAVFLLPFLPLVVWRMPWRHLGEFAAIGAVGAALLVGLYVGLPIGTSEDVSAGNSVTVSVWQRWEAGNTVRGWDFTLGTGFIPLASIGVALLLSLLRPLHALPWVVVALVGLVWSLGGVEENRVLLERMLGTDGHLLGSAVLWVNEHAAPPVVRFPRRWLVPVAFALGTAAAIGLGSVRREPVRLAIAVVLSALGAWESDRLTGYRAHLPHFSAPHPEFATWISEHPAGGAVLYVPSVRGARSDTLREALPVFAEISPTLTSADLLWFQTLTGRPSVFFPEGLRTIVRRRALDPDTDRVLHDLDDLANPFTTGGPIPASSLSEPEVRVRRAESLVSQGLGFVVLDEAALGAEGVRLAKLPFAGSISEERHFEDGTGVTVLVMER